jgi:hypothetical protein
MSRTTTLSYIILAINLGAVVYFLYLTLGPARIPVVHSTETEKTEYMRGEELSYAIHFTKYVPRQVTVTRNIVCNDGNLVTLAPVVDNAPLGENRSVQSFILPMKTSVATCHLDFRATYDINFMRTETLSFISNEFVVVR